MKLLFFCLLVMGNGVYGINCPQYCHCHMADEYRYVGCVNMGLTSIGADIPSSVQWLQLSNNSISTLYNSYFQKLELIQVEKLELDRNAISFIGKLAFYGMDSLDKLDLSSNNINNLDPNTFQYLRRLTILQLNNNPLRTVPAPFLIASSVKILNLRSCNLSYLRNGTFEKMSSLRSIDLSDNELNTFKQEAFGNMPHLKQISLLRNHIKCTKDVPKIIDDLKKRSIMLYGIECGDLTTELFPSKEVISNKKSSISNGNTERPATFLKTTSKNGLFITADGNAQDPDTCRICIQRCYKNIITPLPDTNKVYNWVLIVIAFVTGFSLGTLLAYSSVALYNLYWNCRTRQREDSSAHVSQHVQQTFIPSTIDPTAPPPNYYQLFQLPPR